MLTWGSSPADVDDLSIPPEDGRSEAHRATMATITATTAATAIVGLVDCPPLPLAFFTTDVGSLAFAIIHHLIVQLHLTTCWRWLAGCSHKDLATDGQDVRPHVANHKTLMLPKVPHCTGRAKKVGEKTLRFL